MKRVISILTVLVLSVCLLSSCVNEKPPEEKSGMLFWEATDKKGNKIYLLGSIHVGDDSIYPLNEIVVDAFNESSALAVEADIEKVIEDTETQLMILQEYMYKDGTTIADHIDPTLLQQAKDYLIENDSYADEFLLIKPMFWADMISTLATQDSELTSEKGVDLHFIKEAKKIKKEILEIESIEFQAKMLGNLSHEIQEMYLSDALNNIENAKQNVKELFDMWKEADEKKLEAYVFDNSYPEDATSEMIEDYEEYLKIIYDDRNDGMVKKAEEYLKSGKTIFYVVGAAHMVGDSGIVNQLISKGYVVKKK